MAKTYIGVYLASLCAALLLTPLVIRIARSLKLMDMPSLRKVHKLPVPRLGGVAIALAMLVAALPPLLWGGAFRQLPPAVLAMLAGSVVMLLVGLLDDLFSLPAQVKLLAVVGSALALCATGGRIDVLHLTEHVSLHLGWLAWPVTILWITAVTVSINFIDGLDGLAAGISAVASGVIAILAAMAGDAALAVIALALLGSLTAFLVFNFNPARVFMGDCGSMFLGFSLGSASVLCASQLRTPMGLSLPALALGIPLFDTLFTVIRRGVLERRSVFSAERGHIHHRLMDRGITHRRVVLILYAITAVAAALGLLGSSGHAGHSLLGGAVAVGVLLVLFRFSGAAKPREIISALRRNRAITCELKHARRVFEGSQLSIRAASCFEEWWLEICQAGEMLGALKLSLALRDRSGDERTLIWQRPVGGLQHQEKPAHAGDDASNHDGDGSGNGGAQLLEQANGDGNGSEQGTAPAAAGRRPGALPPSAPSALVVSIPVRHRRVGPPMRLEAEIGVKKNFEGAVHRLSLLARLVEEYSVARLAGGPDNPTRPPRRARPQKRKRRAAAVPPGANVASGSGFSKLPPVPSAHSNGGAGSNGNGNGNGHAKPGPDANPEHHAEHHNEHHHEHHNGNGHAPAVLPGNNGNGAHVD